MVMAEMKDGFAADQTEVDQAAGEAHWQLGKAERHGQWFEAILNRLLKDTVPQTEEDYMACVAAACDARNSMLRRHGHSPFQIALGRDPVIPGDLLDEEPNVAANSAALHDDNFRSAMAVRHAARRVVLEAADCKAFREALDGRPRILRTFETGERVYFWRRGKGQGYKKGRARWHGPGTVIGVEKGNYWLSFAGQVLKTAAEHLRTATHEEVVSAEEVHEMLREVCGMSINADEVEAARVKGYVDLTNEPLPPDAPERPDDLPSQAAPTPQPQPQSQPPQPEVSKEAEESKEPQLPEEEPTSRAPPGLEVQPLELESREEFLRKRRRLEENESVEAKDLEWSQGETLRLLKAEKQLGAEMDDEGPPDLIADSDSESGSEESDKESPAHSRPKRIREAEVVGGRRLRRKSGTGAAMKVRTRAAAFLTEYEDGTEAFTHDALYALTKKKGGKEVYERNMSFEERRHFAETKRVEMCKIMTTKKAVWKWSLLTKLLEFVLSSLRESWGADLCIPPLRTRRVP